MQYLGYITRQFPKKIMLRKLGSITAFVPILLKNAGSPSEGEKELKGEKRRTTIIISHIPAQTPYIDLG